MSLQYSRHDLWRKDYEFNYDLNLLSLSWFRESGDDDDRDNDLKEDKKTTNAFQERNGENLIYLSASTLRKEEYHNSVIEQIVQRFNLSTPTAQLKTAFQHLSFLGHKIHCLSIKDSEGIRRTLRQVEYEQQTITAMNNKYRHQIAHNSFPPPSSSSSSSSSSSLKIIDEIPLPLHLIVIGELEEILFPFPALSIHSQEERDRWRKNLNFLFKNSDSAPSLKNIIVLLNIHHPSHQISTPDTSSQPTVIRSLPQLKEYYGLKFGRGEDFNGDALVGRISRFAVEDVNKPIKPPSAASRHCPDLYNENELDPSPRVHASVPLTSENLHLLEQAASSYFSQIKAISASSSTEPVIALTPSNPFMLLFIALIIALFLLRRRQGPTSTTATDADADANAEVKQNPITTEMSVSLASNPLSTLKALNEEEEKNENADINQKDGDEVTLATQTVNSSDFSEETTLAPEREAGKEVELTPAKPKSEEDINKSSRGRTPFSSPPNEMRLRNGKTYVPKSGSSGTRGDRKRGSTSRSRSRSRSTTLETTNADDVEQFLAPSTSKQARSKEKSVRKRK